MLYLVTLLLGFILGILLMVFMYKRQTTYGEIDIDHYNNLVNFRSNSMEISKLYNKRVIFKINHNSIISRDEHTL